MARRLTNAQMDILAERVVDLIEEAGKEARNKVLQSEEYTKWENNFKDPTLDLVKASLDKLAQVNKDIDKLYAIRNDHQDFIRRVADENKLNYNRYSLEEVPAKYVKKKKEETFDVSMFNRDKMLRKVKADILLSDVDNPDELVKSLVDKLK